MFEVCNDSVEHLHLQDELKVNMGECSASAGNGEGVLPLR
jgi:hypothetical protein